MGRQILCPLTRCSDAQMKVLSADTGKARDMARRNPLTASEGKTVSLVALHMHAIARLISGGCYEGETVTTDGLR